LTRRRLIPPPAWLPPTLIALGVLAWLPFFWQLAIGRQPPLLPYLGAHLAGVLSGVWLRTRRYPDSPSAPFGRRRILASKVLVYLGVLAWAPYLYLTQVADVQVEVGGFLAAHLTGVLGGALLRGSVEAQKLGAARQKDPPSDGA
jgi:hypothetical protein